MICKRCFRLSDDGLAFCPYCGKSFTDDSEQIPEAKDEPAANDTENTTDSADHRENEAYKEPINLWNEPGTTYYHNNTSSNAYAAPKPEKSPFAKLLTSMLHAVCYFVLFLTIQSIVSTGFQTAAMMSASTKYVNDYFETEGIDIGSLSNEEYYELVQKLTIEAQPAMLEAAYAVDVNMISAVSSAVTIVALLVLAKFKKRKFSDHTSLYFTPLKNPRIWAAIPAAISLQSVVIFIINIIPFPESVLESYNALYSFIGESPLWLEILSVVVLAPIVEELVFRGCIHSRLRRSMKPLTAAIISAFIFGVAHGHIISATYAFILGLVLTYLYEKYNSVIVSIIFHMAFNASNYIPIMTADTTVPEMLIIVITSAIVFAICAAIIISGPPHKEKEIDKGI